MNTASTTSSSSRAAQATAVDPVCGMMVQADKAAARMTFEGKTYLFCSTKCRDKFAADPGKYLVPANLERFHLVADVIDRVPTLGCKAAYLKQQVRDKFIEHREYIECHGQDMPEILEWQWPTAPGEVRVNAA